MPTKETIWTEIAIVLVIFILASSLQAARYEHDPASGSKKLAFRWEEVNYVASALLSLLPLLRKIDGSGGSGGGIRKRVRV